MTNIKLICPNCGQRLTIPIIFYIDYKKLVICPYCKDKLRLTDLELICDDQVKENWFSILLFVKIKFYCIIKTITQKGEKNEYLCYLQG